jgi:uncharacterized protein (TIGR00369 family)
MTTPASPPTPPTGAEIVGMMLDVTPWTRALGFSLLSVGDARARVLAPYRADLIGDPETGVIAGGVLSALLDQCCGAAVMAAMTERQSIATLDLRIDYMRGAIPGRDIIAEAHCYKVTRSVAFVRAVAFEDSAEDPVANATAAFMLASDGGRRPGANRKAPR